MSTPTGEARGPASPTPETTKTRGRVPSDSFANRLVLARRLAGMTIREAAAAADVNYGSWSNWENGKRPADILDLANRVSRALDVDHDWLLFGGPLTSARGRPTNRSGSDTDWYPTSDLGTTLGYGPYPTPTDRPMAPVGHPGNLRPKGREDRSRPMSPGAPGRRAALVR